MAHGRNAGAHPYRRPHLGCCKRDPWAEEQSSASRWAYQPCEPRFQGFTAKEWRDWVLEPDGSTWCENKRYEADCLVNWMVGRWGLEHLRSGRVLDVGGEPGFLAAALLSQGISATVVDPTWDMTGKDHWANDCKSAAQFGACLEVFRRNFDLQFLAEHRDLVQGASAVVSLYGDEATAPTVAFASRTKKPCAIIPCNECVHFYPEYDQTYEGYCEALLQSAWWQGGSLELVLLEGVPFSRALLVQHPAWSGPPPQLPGLQLGLMRASEWERRGHRRQQAEKQQSSLPQLPQHHPFW
ncbi:unnamed protein product [Effrenium voratum]|nr:unnamed protein product [Effrenium voratum]